MEALIDIVIASAERAVKQLQPRAAMPLDFTEQSLRSVDELLAQFAAARGEYSEKDLVTIERLVGCYILEVGRRTFGGAYRWFDQRKQPVLVVGEPTFHVAMITWDKVRGRMAGDEADDIPFFFEGFASRVRRGKPGDHVLYV
jgi:hypothetical protein